MLMFRHLVAFVLAIPERTVELISGPWPASVVAVGALIVAGGGILLIRSTTPRG